VGICLKFFAEIVIRFANVVVPHPVQVVTVILCGSYVKPSSFNVGGGVSNHKKALISEGIIADAGFK
jgi:hypothetical protein